MKTITFYSYKGGVGRTLVLANIAKRLANFGKKVCIIDFDIEAPGLHQKFEHNLNQDKIKRGIVDYIHEFSYNNKLPKSIKDYTTKISHHNSNSGIDIIPAGNVKTKKYWKKLAQINWGKLFYEKDSQGVAFFIDMKQKIEKEINPDFLLIDSRTGITDISGVTLSILADEVIILLTNNKENIEGTKLITNTLSVPKNTFAEGRPKINIILSRIPYFAEPDKKYIEYNTKKFILNEINEHLKNNKRNLSFEKLLVIHSDPNLQLAEKLKNGYEFHENIKIKTSPIASDYLALFNEITKDALSEEEKIKFETLRKSEYLIDKAKQTQDNAIKIKFLNEAIELNPKSDEAYQKLAISYYLKNNKKALDCINKSLKINPLLIHSQYVKGVILFALKEFNKAKEIFEQLIEINSRYSKAIIYLGHVFAERENFKKAIKYYEEAIKIEPQNSNIYNSIGITYKVLNDYEKAFDYIYKALELDPKEPYATGTLAEIYAEIGNLREFYKNLDLSFSFGMSENEFNRIINEESVYKSFLNDKKFLDILDKYNIKIHE